MSLPLMKTRPTLLTFCLATTSLARWPVSNMECCPLSLAVLVLDLWGRFHNSKNNWLIRSKKKKKLYIYAY